MMRLAIVAITAVLDASLARAGCIEHWALRGFENEMRDVCQEIESVNSNGLIVIMKKKPKGCSPKGPASSCNPLSTVSAGEDDFNGLIWFEADGGFGFDLLDRRVSSGVLTGEHGGSPIYFEDLKAITEYDGIEMIDVDSIGELSIARYGESSELFDFNQKIINHNSWISSALQGGVNIIFIQQEE